MDPRERMKGRDHLKSPETERSQKYALISVSDKTGIVELARTLDSLGHRIISTGGTARTLSENGLSVIPIEEITEFPECLGGRIKTLNPRVEGGILYKRGDPSHVETANEYHFPNIEIVVCSLYPFEQAVQKKDATLDDAIENIDIGGPTMIRAAAKNFEYVLVVTDPKDYQRVADALRADSITPELRMELAQKVFNHTAFYDSQIANFLARKLNKEGIFPEEIILPGRKAFDLRYGENPDQKGAVYLEPNTKSPLKNLQRHAGRELGLVNITDINAGLESVRLFEEPAAVVIKHNSPCGIAVGTTYAEALERAINGDPESAFGGIVVVNGTLDLETARVIERFNKEGRGNMDIVAAPFIDEDALELLKAVRESTGIYTFGDIPKPDPNARNLKWIDGGYVLQTAGSTVEEEFKDWEIATKIEPTPQQLKQMQIAWKFIKRIRSNTVIVIDKNLPMTIGIGSGQTSRIRSARIALDQARQYAQNAILASDSFFPFDDTVRLAAAYRIGAIVQQGESRNDKASINLANRVGIPMVFTHHRAFWH